MLGMLPFPNSTLLYPKPLLRSHTCRADTGWGPPLVIIR